MLRPDYGSKNCYSSSRKSVEEAQLLYEVEPAITSRIWSDTIHARVALVVTCDIHSYYFSRFIRQLSK